MLNLKNTPKKQNLNKQSSVKTAHMSLCTTVQQSTEHCNSSDYLYS